MKQEIGSRLAPEPSGSLLLGGRLRPIVFGGTSGAPNAFAAVEAGHAPHLAVSVHSRSGRLLGYAVVDRPTPQPTWGGLTVAADLSLTSALVLARVTARQLSLFRIHKGSHHCVVVGDAERSSGRREETVREFLDALHPLVREGLCRIAVTSRNGRLEPPLAAQGVAISAAVGTLAALDHAGLDGTLAKLAVVGPTPLAWQCALEAGRRGLRVEVDPGRGIDADADVLLVGAPFWSLEAEQADAIRARAIVLLGPATIAPTVERRLHERGVVVIPDTISTAGAAVALDLRARGLDQRSALARAGLAVDDRLRELLTAAARAGEPLTWALRLGETGVPGVAAAGRPSYDR